MPDIRIQNGFTTTSVRGKTRKKIKLVPLYKIHRLVSHIIIGNNIMLYNTIRS